MDWQEIAGNWVYLPRNPVGIIHFLGGAFVGTAPHVTYRLLLEELAARGYAIAATPFVNTFDHGAIAREVLEKFETCLARLYRRLDRGYLPVYGLGHSMGCKLHLLAGSFFEVERAGNVLMAFNNFPVRRSIPLFGALDRFAPALEDVEFTPSPKETEEAIARRYRVRRNLLVKFRRDDIDNTLRLAPLLEDRFGNSVTLQILPGNHLTPLSQGVNWQAGAEFSPLDALGQWVKQETCRDLLRLKAEILRWLDPLGNF